MNERAERLKQNVDGILQRIATAAEQAGRSPTDVKLVAVTKYVDAEVIRDLAAAGCNEFGESRPQVLWPKAEALTDLKPRWHQIGHLQRNKLRRTMPIVDLIHSVDSLRLLSAIADTQVELDPNTPKAILLEVNVSEDEAKHGFKSDALQEAVDLAIAAPSITLRGLMCMAGYGTDPDEARKDFALLRETRERLVKEYDASYFAELSMGMSGDFEQAIAEGATLVRVGSALFDGVI